MSEKIRKQYCDGQQDASEYADLIEDLVDCLNEHLLVRFSAMLDSADEELFEQGQRVEGSEQQAYIDAMQVIRAERGNLGKQFFIALNDSLKPADDSGDDGDDSDELSLVGHDEMEELVAITTMHSRAMNLYGHQVDSLEARLEYLELKVERIFDRRVLIPQGICKVFQAAMQPYRIETAHRLIFYTLFDRHVCAMLEAMYDDLNRLLVKRGILPNIVLRTQKAEHERDARSDDVDAPWTHTPRHPDAKQQVDSVTLPDQHRAAVDFEKIVNQLLSGGATFSGEGVPESFSRMAERTDEDGEKFYSREDVTRALCRLQNSLIVDETASKPLGPEMIKRAIMLDIGNANGGAATRQVHTLDERTIDFVGMIFDAITCNENISQVVTNLLLRLQIPVIKVALIDEELFDEATHPARKTLDLVSEAGKGIESVQDRLYDDIEEVVDGVLKEYDIDIESFERAAEALQILIENEKEIADNKEKEEQRQILCAHAREVVVTELRNLTANKRIPKNVQPLVLKHWSTLMLNRYIREGRDSEQWMQSLLLLRTLMRFLQPPGDEADWKNLDQKHEALVESIQQEFAGSRQDPASVSSVLDALKEHFRNMLDCYDFSVSRDGQAAVTAPGSVGRVDLEGPAAPANDDDTGEDVMQRVDESELAAMQDARADAREKIIRMPSTARPGVWFEVYNGDDRPVRRLKLSMVLTEVARLIFVNSRGVRVIEKDVGEFVEELEQNRSRMIADHSAFEAALGSVIHRLAA